MRSAGAALHAVHGLLLAVASPVAEYRLLGSGLQWLHAVKDGPPLVMTGASHGFSRAAAPVWGFSEI